jgi:ATP-dependent RNA helicase DeaD
LSEQLLRIVEELKFKEPSEIQAKSIPLVIQGKDVIGSASTGSGKTLAFGAGIIERVKKGEGVQALVLTPTRELAEQNARSLRIFSKNHGLEILDVYGGVSIENQIRNIPYADVIVGTPWKNFRSSRKTNIISSENSYSCFG